MKKLTTTTAVLLFCATMASAAINTDALVAGYQAQGFTRVEVRTGLTQTKVEAIRGTEKLEVIYDSATGAVLKRETGTIDAGEETAPGVSVRGTNRDFVDVGDDDDADDADDADDDGGADVDDENDDDQDSDDEGRDDQDGDDEGDDDQDGDGDHSGEGDGDDHDSDDD